MSHLETLADRIAALGEPRARRALLRDLRTSGALADMDLIALLRASIPRREESPESARRICRFAYVAARAHGNAQAAQAAQQLLGFGYIVSGQARRAVWRIQRVREQMPAPGGARLGLSLAQAYAMLARFDEALAVLRDTRHVVRGRGTADFRARLDVAEGHVHQARGRSRDALVCFERGRRTLARTAPQATVSGVDMDRATALTNLEEYDKAELIYRRVERAQEEAGMRAAALQTSYNHAYLRFVRGEFHDALRRFRGLRLRFDDAGDRRHVALCDIDEAEIGLHMNLPAHAAELCTRAARVMRDLGMPAEVARAEFFGSVAERSLGNHEDARRRLERAEQAFRELGNAMWWGVSLHRLAELDLEEGRAGRAARRARHAVKLLREQGLRERAGYAEVLLAKIERRGGDRPAARARLQRLLQEIEERDLPWLRCEIHRELAQVHRDEDPAQAVRHILRCTNLLERHRMAVPPDEYMAAFLTSKARLFRDAMRMVLDLGGPFAQERAFLLAEQARSRALLDLLRHQQVHERPGADRKLEREAWRLEREIDGLASRMPSIERGAHADDAERRATEVSHREARLRACLDKLAERDPAGVRMRRGTPPTVHEVQAGLAVDETLVEYFLGEDELVTFVVDRKSMHVHRRALTPTYLRDLLTRTSFQLDRPNLMHAAVPALAQALLPSAHAVLDELHRLLIEPIHRHLTRKRIVVVPHGALNGIPFHALGFEGRPLIEDHEVVQAPSASIYLHACRPRTRTARTALLLGVPDEIAPDIRREVEQLSGFVPRNRCYIGAEATSERLRRFGRLARLIHVAAHARFDRDDPMESGVRLADGWLTIPRIAELRLEPELLVLAGCATGQVSVTEGGELFGLVRGFLQAGARAMVTSFWPVPDERTTAFMQVFHTQLAAGHTPAAALRATALAVRAEHPHPFHWAPFVLLGDGG